MKKDIEWSRIKAEYVNGKGSLSELAQKYGATKSAVQKRSAKEKWSEQKRKKDRQKADKLADEIQKQDIKQTVKDIERCCRAAGRLIDKINKGISEVDKEVFISTDELTREELLTKGEEGKPDVLNRKNKRKIKLTRYNTLVDTKRIEMLSKSLLNIKQVLTDIDSETDRETVGIIEIPQMTAVVPPEETENEQ